MTRMHQVVAYVFGYHADTGQVPSYSQIGDALRIEERSMVRRYVAQAEEAGYWTRDGEMKGGRGPRRGQRIRLGNVGDLMGKQMIRMGRDG